jgi:hypothetical protein
MLPSAVINQIMIVLYSTVAQIVNLRPQVNNLRHGRVSVTMMFLLNFPVSLTGKITTIEL